MTYRPPTFKLAILTATIALLISAGIVVSRPIDVVVDGVRMESDVPPVTTGPQSVFVPLRSIAEALGARAIVEPKSNMVVIVRGSDALKLRAGDVHATLDGMPMTLERAPFSVRGRIMVGLRTISRAFGVRVSYDPIAGRIDVMTPGVGEAPPTSSLTSETQ